MATCIEMQQILGNREELKRGLSFISITIPPWTKAHKEYSNIRLFRYNC